MLDYSDFSLGLVKTNLREEVVAGNPLFPLDCYNGGIHVICHRCGSTNINIYFQGGELDIDKFDYLFPSVINNSIERDWFLKSIVHSDTIVTDFCRDCGWWYLEHIEPVLDNDILDRLRLQVCGSIQKFTENNEIPLEELSKYLYLNLTKLNDIDPNRFELMINEFLKVEWKNAEVIHVGCKGGGGDGGVDFLLIKENEEYLVQVKHRYLSQNKKEGVKFIRELNGVLMREKKRKGIFITSAKGFTRAAKNEVEVTKNNNSKYELCLLDRLDIDRWILKAERSMPWKRIFRNREDREISTFTRMLIHNKNFEVLGGWDRENREIKGNVTYFL